MTPRLSAGQRSAHAAGGLFALAWIAACRGLAWGRDHPRITVIAGAFIAGAILAGPAGVTVVAAGMLVGAWWVCSAVPDAPGRLVRRFTVDPHEHHAHQVGPPAPGAVDGPGRTGAECRACGAGHQDRQVWLVGRSPITGDWQCLEMPPPPLSEGGPDGR